ncbi:MAG: Glu/Leu/Phe/Val dehydrogenase [Candidatus Aenigmatarchaeota archaeon]|nr:Glu/Leu/Phe/Val dehydrogenase [Candidatus Aenigmarchaeota archaeon]
MKLANMHFDADEIGPELVVEVYNKKIGLKGILIIDNTKRGVAKGGIRMTSSATVEEIFRLARAMTFKNALADLPFGGGKSGIVSDTKNKEEKRLLIQGFARAIKELCPSRYIAGPDVNTGEEEMRWFAEANGCLDSCTGKPKELGGLPHELGSTGFGVAQATLIALDFIKLDVNNTKVAIDGFGNVGSFTAKFLYEEGAKIIAVSDSKGCIYNPKGLDVEKLLDVKSKTGSVINYREGKAISRENIFEIYCDVLIPASLSDVINESNYENIKAKIIVEAANIPMREHIEKRLFERGIVIIPDIIANAGGVISSYAEYKKMDEQEMFNLVKEKIVKNTKLILERSFEKQMNTRDVAMEIAKERIL